MRARSADSPFKASSSSRRVSGIGLAPLREKLDTATSQALPKLADQQLEKFVTTRYPRLTMRWWGTGYRDRDSYGAGVADGGNITLHRGITHRTGNRGLTLPGD